MIILKIFSDLTMIITTILLINAFGISKLLDKKKQTIAVLISAILSSIIALSYVWKYNEISVLIYPLMFVIAFFIAFGRIKISQVYLALTLEFITSLLSSSVALIAFQIYSFTYRDLDAISLFCVRIVFLIVAIVLNFKKLANRFYSVLKNIPKHIFVLIIIALTFITCLSVCNNYQTSNIIKQSVVTILIALLTITLIIMIFSLLINVASKNYYTALNSLLEKQVATQISHYEKLEKLNSDMRTFRHDYINHLSSINALIGEGCYSDAQKYIDKLTESTHRNEAIYLTGNRLADAILTDKSDSCKDFADIEFDGCITDKIENSDICIILANSLDNAIEACKKCPKRGKISIAAQIRQGYWTMTMRNPTVSSDSEGIMKTSKEDEKSHGFGLLSIEQAVKKYDGTMAVSIQDGVFEMAVVLKIPVKN